MNFRFKPPLRGVFASVGSIFGMGRDADKSPVVDVGEDGEQLYKEDVIKYVLEELQSRKTERQPLEEQWTLNANFLVGNQYCDINPYRGDIEQLDPVYDWLERETFNRIAPLVETRIANLKKINYRMTVKPRTNELDDYAKADVSTAILQYIQSESDFETRKNTMIAWNELCGNCFWMSWWDKNKGDELARKTVTVVGENGLEEKNEMAVYSGDLDYGLLTPYEIYPESIFKQGVETQRSIITEQVKSVEEIYDLYGVQAEGSDIETFALTPMASGGGLGRENTVTTVGHRTTKNAQKVITYFERPSKHRPDGRMIIIVGDEHLVYYGPLPYHRIPIEQVICKEVAGQFFGKSVIEDLIPLQRAYNGCVNRIHEFIKNVAIQGYLVEEGSIDVEEYEENGVAPGALLVYNHGHNPPVRIPNSNFPAEVMQERYNLANDMEYVAGVSQLMVTGNTPSGVTSGTAIQNLQEIDNTRLSLTGDHIRNSIKNLARLWLEIYKQYATVQRTIRYVGSNKIASCLVWSNEDINSFDIEYATENELLLSEEAQKQRFFEAYNMGLFTDDTGQIPARVKQQALAFMKIGNYSEIMSMNDLQIQAAQRENVFFEEGVLPEIGDFDDHKIHIEEHFRYVLQMRFHVFKMKKPELAEMMNQHIKLHQNALDQQNNAMMENGMIGGMNHGTGQ